MMKRAGVTLIHQIRQTSSRHLSTTSVQYQRYQDHHEGNDNFKKTAAILGLGTGLGILYWKNKRPLYAKEVQKIDKIALPEAGARKKGLPQYNKGQVQDHDDEEKRIWVTYKNGVYDITDFVSKHPGAKNILMAAGGPLEPFWNLYAVHQNNSQVFTLLEEYRIGNLDPKDVKENEELAKSSDPYLMEPKNRNPGLLVKSKRPFNAETPLEVLAENFYTPNDWFYVRNHLPTPDVTAEEYELDVVHESNQNEKMFKLEDLKTKFEKVRKIAKYFQILVNIFSLFQVEVTSTIQCGGNRRAEMNQIKEIKGLMWKGGAIGNAKWAGVRLSDVLKEYDLNGIKHVQFEGYDEGSDGSPYGASIPIAKAMSGDVILAYEMNGDTLPRDHGYPIRYILTFLTSIIQVCTDKILKSEMVYF